MPPIFADTARLAASPSGSPRASASFVLLAALVAPFLVLTFLHCPPVRAEDEPTPWATPLQGVENVLSAGSAAGALIVTPMDAEEDETIAELLREKLLDVDAMEIVMDDAPLGDVSERSDDEIAELAWNYPVDVVFIIRTFPGKEGPTAVMRVETADERTMSFRLRRGRVTEYAAPAPAPQPEQPDPLRVARERADERGRETAAVIRSSAVRVTETHRLVAAEQRRKMLTFEEAGAFGYVLDTEGSRLEWPDAYQRIADESVVRSYRTRRAARTATLVGGGVLAAAGVGLLFVSLGNQANCDAGDTSCARPVLMGAGIAAAGAGTLSILTGSLISPHPAPPSEVRSLVERYNRSLTE